MTPADFVGTYGTLAQYSAGPLGLSRYTILTQWAYETGWASPDSGVPFNNLAGIRYIGPQNPAGFSIFASLDDFANTYDQVLRQANMASVLAKAGQGPEAELSGFGSAEWVGTDPAANAQYAANLMNLYRTTIAPLVEVPPSPPAPPVVPPSPSPSVGWLLGDRDFLFAQLVKVAEAVNIQIATPPWVPQNVRTYIVKTGDTLLSIAAQYLGDEGRWQEIYDLTAEVLGVVPSHIEAGTVVVLPNA